jgi:histidinol phosphatase-like PHP family hydrolase
MPMERKGNSSKNFYMLKQVLNNKEVSAILQEVALLLDLKGENPFKVKAYSQAARSIEILEEDLGIIIQEGRLREMKGIGETLAQHITELVTTGRLQLEGFTIFKGIESDILPDGSLDYEEAILKQFDFVIASVHSHLNLSREEMTQRVIKALRNPYTTILGHPTGRLLLAREPYAIGMIRIIDEASRSGVAIELNAHPYRLDIDWRLCKYAKEKGIQIAINPDAHDEEGLKDTYYGVGIGRKGWLETGDVLNTMDLDKMKDFLKRRKPS